MPSYAGGCHCGAIAVEFESAREADDLDVRECACSFCRTHGARTMTDPNGRARIVAQPTSLNRYRFGLGTADFIVCRKCGAYVAAYFDDDDGAGFATLNVNVLEDRAAFTKPATSANYEAEDAAGRVSRRRARWTPADLVLKV